jgi:hypothetical protein
MKSPLPDHTTSDFMAKHRYICAFFQEPFAGAAVSQQDSEATQASNRATPVPWQEIDFGSGKA